MDVIASYKIAMTTLIPVFSAIACGILVALSLQDCLTDEEKRLKRITLVYFLLSGTGWFVTFCYQFIPVFFVWLNVVCLLSFVLPSIFFYRIVRYLTRLGKPEDFSWFHYLLPGVLATTLLVWSFLVPFEVQLVIVKGKAHIIPEGYELYMRFFTTKPLLRVIFGLAYYFLSIWVLVVYYKRAIGKDVLVRRPAKWVVFLVGISIASLLSSLLPTSLPRSQIFYSFWMAMVAWSIAGQHVLLSYHIIRRDYLLYIIPEKIKVPSSPEAKAPLKRKRYAGKINRRRFEKFFREKKPYLKPDYKITDLVNDLDVSRTDLSAFINLTYGVNFNRYLNRCRLKELNRIRLQAANQGKSISSLYDQAGFNDFRNYTRAVAAERKDTAKPAEGQRGSVSKAGSQRKTNGQQAKDVELQRVARQKANTTQNINSEQKEEMRQKTEVSQGTDASQTGHAAHVYDEQTAPGAQERAFKKEDIHTGEGGMT